MYRSTSGRRYRNARFLLCVALLSGLATAGVCRISFADSAPRLSQLELLIPSSLTLEAARERIRAAEDVLEHAEASSGLRYFAQSIMGPRSDVVSIAYGNNSILRYAQRAGVSMPLLGSRDREQEDILAAQTDAELRRIDLATQRRLVLAGLREAYIQYWQYTIEESVARRFLELGRNAIAPAYALKKTGFWTQANLLAFLDQVDHVKADVLNFGNARATSLARLAAIADHQIDAFVPPEPDLPETCPAHKDHVIASALTADGQIRRFDAEIERREASLSMVRWSSVDATADLGLGGYTDAPRGLGYDLTFQLNLSVPRHRRLAELAYERSLRAEIKAYRNDEEQRRLDLIANVDTTLDELGQARLTLSHSLVDAAAKKEALRVARIRFADIPMSGAAGFNDVQLRTTESYASEQALADARAQVYLKLNELLLLAPGACASSPVASGGESSAP
jgi:outer membrane protein TolC